MGCDAPTFIPSHAGVEPSATAILDIVFVHGLSGDRFETWRGSEECFWLEWLADHFAYCNIYTAGYDTELFYNRLTGPGASVQDLATVLADGIASRSNPAPNLLLVTHSLGGLIVKQMVRKCSDSADPAFNKLARSVKGVVFFATPHQGAALSTALDTILAKFKSKAVKQLAYGDEALTDLHEFFRNWATKNQVAVKPFYETEKTWGMHVVDPITANPNVFGADPIAVQADHVGICKPTSRESLVYRSMVTLITHLLESCSAARQHQGTATALIRTSGTTLALPAPAPHPALGDTVPLLIEPLGLPAAPMVGKASTIDAALPDGLAPDILADYQFYTATAEGDRRDLAAKLNSAGRFYQAGDAERKKERFNMALRRHIAQPAAMTRYTKLMADVETRFHRHVDRLTSTGADIETVDDVIQKAVIDPCTAIHSTAGLEISASLVDNAIYYLAGNCHLRWDNDAH